MITNATHAKNILFVLTFMVSVILTGCSTTHLSSSQAKRIPDSNQLLYKAERNNTVPVLVIRDSGINHSHCTTEVMVNGRVAAFIKAGEKVTLHLPPGETVISAENSGGLCGGMFDAYEASISLGHPKQFRIGFDASGSLRLTPSARR